MAERLHLRIFLSSPDDVAEERDLARRVVKEELSVDPFIRDRVSIDVVGWDDPHAAVPMPAHLTPQAAVNQGLAKPSQCDIVLVILWGRIGTPLPAEYRKPTGEPYRSGTEWEYEDALAAANENGKPTILVYRRSEKPRFAPMDPELDAKRAQYQMVEDFFAQFRNPDGSLSGGFTAYETPDTFRERLVQHLRSVIRDRLDSRAASARARTGTAGSFQGRARAFIDEYLKSELGPVPFGGRDQELERLDAWLADPVAGSRLAITAPAGRGKSALLVQWTLSLEERGILAEGGWPLVFVPISIRVGTNAPEVFYQSLARQLAELAGVALETPAIDAAAYYADQARDHLSTLAESEKRVLVVLDGLDEALRGEFDPTIFPRVLPPTARILVSARWQAGDADSAGWLRRLDWDSGVKRESFELDKLDDSAIGDVLVKMGAPLDVVGSDPELVRRLTELTEGEPLLLRFYAEDLWQKLSERVAHITRSDLDNLKPGFGAYFERWLSHQKKLWAAEGQSFDQQTIDAVLAVLAFALAPLEADDLLTLAGDIHDAPRTLSPATMLEPLRRFVMGDGSRETGYVLSHPKIGEHLQKQYFSQHVAQQTQAGFAEWGRSMANTLNSGERAPETAPPYLLQFHARHLQAVDAPAEDFLSLVENGWRQAWEHYEGSQQGFSNDVRLAWQAVRSSGALADLGAQFRCALTLSSIRSLGHNMPYQLIVAALKHNVLSIRQASHLASFMSDRADYVRTLIALATANETRAARKAELLAAALASARTIDHAFSRARALGALTGHLSSRERGIVLGEALASARAIDKAASRAEALKELMGHLLSDERAAVLGEALASARAVDDATARARAFGALAARVPPQERAAVMDEALVSAKAIDDPAFRAHFLGALAEHVPPEARMTVMDEALASARAIADASSRSSALVALAVHLSPEAWPAVIDEALASAKAIVDAPSRSSALVALAGHLSPEARTAVIDEELASAKAIENESARARVLGTLAEHVSPEARTAVMEQALTSARAIVGASSRSSVLMALAGHLSPEARTAVMDEALASAKAVNDDFFRGRDLEALAGHLSPAQVGEALASAKMIENASGCAGALEALAGHVSPAQVGEALALAKTIEDASARARVLGVLAGHLSPAQVGEALEWTKAIDDALARARALGTLASLLTPETRATVLGEALASARTIGKAFARARALWRLAGLLAPETRAAVMDEALASAKMIGDARGRADVLGALAGHLSPERQASVMEGALASAKMVDDARGRADALGALAGRLSPERRALVMEEALASVKEIKKAHVRAAALGAIAGYLPPETRAAVIDEALVSAKAIDDASSRARALGALAGHLSPERRAVVMAEALASANAIDQASSRAHALRVLAGHLSPAQVGEALASAKAIDHAVFRAGALEALARYLSPAQVGETLALAKTTDNALARGSLVEALAGHLSPAQAGEALALVKGIDYPSRRARALAALAGDLSPEQMDEALAAVKAIDNASARAQALGALARHFVEPQYPIALAEFVNIGDRLARREFLTLTTRLLPIVSKFVGEEGLQEFRRAICDTATWYP